MEVFMGTILPFGFDFPPVDWMSCNGQLISISQNSALFALLGTFYGGDGQITFGLPDLRGRMPIGFGNAPGLGNYAIGDKAGNTNITLTSSQMPAHTHTVLANPANPQAAGNLQVGVQVAGTASNPVTAPTATNNILGASGTGPQAAGIWSDALTNPQTLGGTSINTNAVVGAAGNNLPVPITNPYLALNFCLAVNGIFPSRQ